MLFQPGERLWVALAFEEMAEMGIAIGRQPSYLGIKQPGCGLKLFQMTGGIAAAERVVRNNIQPLTQGFVELGKK